MPVNTGYLSELTSHHPSHLSIRGRVVWHSAMSSVVGSSFATVRVASGTALAPSVAFTSEASLGLYRSAASQLAMSYGQFIVADGSAILPSVAFASDVSRGFYRSAASTIATTSGITLDLRTGTTILSWDTRANSSGMTTGNLRLIFAASGMSLVYSSGGTTYTVGASAVSAAQA